MTSTEKLLLEIEAFLAINPMGETQFGVVSCGNSKLVSRLRSGSSCSLDTADKVRGFIRGFSGGPLANDDMAAASGVKAEGEHNLGCNNHKRAVNFR